MSSLDPEWQFELNSEYCLSADQIEFYRENGYIRLKGVFSPELIEGYRASIAEEVDALSKDRLPLEQRTTYGKAFLQIMNLWVQSEEIREFAFSKRVARIAAELMGATGVRMYHDQALYKEPHGGLTPWHADQYYWPLASDKTVTAWIPLIDVPLSMGPLAFCPKSHRFQMGRDLAISDESEETLKEKLSRFGIDEGSYAAGDVSFHSGWTFHRAGGNNSDTMREVFTIIYTERDTVLAEPKNKNQIKDWDTWCPGVKVGEVVNSPLNPILYESGR